MRAGLLTLDMVDLEVHLGNIRHLSVSHTSSFANTACCLEQVLKRSGTPQQAKDAMAIMPILRNPHLLLVTLLLCNAAAVEVSTAAGLP